MAAAVTEPQVICDRHGPMRFRFAELWWTCAGFDGEGCDEWPVVRDETIYEFGDSIPGLTVRLRVP